MDTIFINTKNSKTTEPHRFRLYSSGKLDKYNNNKFKISGPK